MSTEITTGTMIRRWGGSERPLFKGRLIDADGCVCAQGDVLRLAGMSDDDLRYMLQENADRAVAKLLGISQAESVLLRNVNDSGPGLPQAVLDLSDAGIGSVIGPEWRTIVRFWRHVDGMDAAAWAAARAARKAATAVAGTVTWVAVAAARKAAAAAAVAGTVAAGTVARKAAAAAGKAAAGTAAWEAAGGATNEIQGRHGLTSFFFLPLFGFATPDAVDARYPEVCAER